MATDEKPRWKFKGLTFRYNDPKAKSSDTISCCETLAKCLQAMRAKLGEGHVLHLGIGVARKFPRRPNGSAIVRYVYAGPLHDKHRVLTGHYNGLILGPAAIDIKEWNGHNFNSIYRTAVLVMREHPEWRMSVVLEPHWCHLEVSYPHLEGIDDK